MISTVSLWLQDCLHQFSPWSGKMIFGAVVHICRPMMLPKNDGFEFSWISRRDRVGFSKLFGPAYQYALLCHSQCFQFSSPSLQRLTRFDKFKNFYPFFWLAQLVDPRIPTMPGRSTSVFSPTRQMLRGNQSNSFGESGGYAGYMRKQATNQWRMSGQIS